MELQHRFDLRTYLLSVKYFDAESVAPSNCELVHFESMFVALTTSSKSRIAVREDILTTCSPPVFLHDS